MKRICICRAGLVVALMAPVAAAFAGVATASDGSFEFRGSVDLAGTGGGETLCELPGLLRLVVRQAGKDPALARYDRELGNYLNFPLADGSVPVFEAEFPNARHSIAPWYLKELPPGCRIGVPLAVLPAKKGPRAFRVVCAKTRVRLYVDGALYDEESLVAPLAPAVGSELRSRSPRLAGAELVAPAPADAFGREPDERPVEGPIQYWTSDGYNTWVGDVVCCRFRGRLHVFYLKDRRHHRSKGGSGGHCFAHISSADLVRWTAHPDAVPVEDWWMTVGTGTPFELDGKLCLSYGIHSTRFVPQERTTEPAMFAEYERTGVMPQVRFAGTDLVPLGATWAESEDGVRFRPSGVLFHTTQNPGIQNLQDGRLKLVTVFFLDVGAKGVFVSRGMGGWKAVDDPNPLSGDCPCPFEWNGHRYLLQGFSGYARAKGDAPLAKAPGSDIYDGLGVPMVAPWGENRRLLIGWLRHHYGWGGWLVFRELVQREDGTLGTKWVDEIRLPSPVVTTRAKGGERFVRDFTRADGRETIRLTVDPKAGAAFLSTVAADGRECRRPVLSLLGDSPVTGIRDLGRDYAVRYVLHYDRKADTTVFDAEIAGNRTLIAECPGRLRDCRDSK